MTASGHNSSPRNSLRGSTRGTGMWHLYTAIYDQKKSEMYVDGFCEATGKNVGTNSLDGLSIGCDHGGIFYLTGAIAEIRVFSCHLSAADRVQIESSLVMRYGIDYSYKVEADPPTRGSADLFQCGIIFRVSRRALSGSFLAHN